MKFIITSTLLAAAATVATGTAIANDSETDTTTRSLEVQGLGEVFFEFDSARAPASDDYAAIATYAKEHPGQRIVLDAYTDPVGSTPYNVALAIRRGKSIETKLIAAGVPAERIVIVSYGEEGLRRSAFQYDRRVTVWASGDPLYAIIDHSLVTGTSVTWDEPVAAAELEPPREPVASR